MQSTQYLNLEYILVRAYALFTGVDVSSVPHQTIQIIEIVAWLGVTLSFIFIVLVIFFRIRLVQVEHSGWHARKAQEEALAHKHHEKGGNPRWTQVMELAASASDGDWRRAILEADIILSDALRERGYAGETVAEQLKSANPLQMNTLDLAWAAHKVRNAVAHLGEAYPLTDREAHATIDQYARVFEEFGII